MKKSLCLRAAFTAAAMAAMLFLLPGCPDPTPELRTVRMVAAPRVADPGETIQFQDLSLLFEGETAVAWAWDFGDGATSTEQNPAHAYDLPNTYTVTLKVTTNVGTIEVRTEQNFIAVRSEEESTPAAGEEKTFAGIPFVWIEPGSFIMGSENDQWGDLYEQPAREVTLSHGFWISKTEITQGQWIEIMNENPAFFVDPAGQRPVEQVSWEDAQAFVSRLNLITNGTFRLPSEAEWEYACRAGTATEWSFGATPDLAAFYAWFWENARFASESAGTLIPNAWGLQDMHGNVAEWCQDYFNPRTYSNTGSVDPAGVAWSYYRAVRGGSWADQVHQCRSAYRDFLFPSVARNTVGIRLCRN